MKKIATTIGIIALVVLLVGCTPQQVAWWTQRQAEVAATPDPADDIALDQLANQLLTIPHTSCSQWYWAAIDAGWTQEQWMTLNYIMWRESRCDPSQVNPNGGASGLLQEMPMWADDCGGSVSDLLNPYFNLRCGRHILAVQGWGAWSTYNG